MKFNFKKITSVIACTALLGSTLGFAAAVNYPEPFVTGGTADVAVVIGANGLDAGAALTIGTSLGNFVTSTTGEVSGEGDKYLIEKSQNKFNLGDKITDIKASVDEGELKDMLASGEYMESDNEQYSYTQSVDFNSLELKHYQNDDVGAAPVIGFEITDGSAILNYTLDFTDQPSSDIVSGDLDDIESSTMTIMGRPYYVLNADNGTNVKLTLLDSANSKTVEEGTPQTIVVGTKTHEVSAKVYSDSKAKIIVNGEETDSLTDGDTDKLSDGTYVGVKEVLYNAKESGVSSVEITLGVGKLIIENGEEVELNSETVENLYGYITMGTASAGKEKIDKIQLQWVASEDLFVNKGDSIVLPGFETIKLMMTDFVVPAKEEISLGNSGSNVVQLKAPIKDGDATISLLRGNESASGRFSYIGQDTDKRLKTSSSSSIILNTTLGEKFLVASYATTTEGQSYYLEVTSVDQDSTTGINTTTIKNVLTGSSYEIEENDDQDFGGDVTITVLDATEVSSGKGLVNLSINTVGGSFQKLYTNEGLTVYLPLDNAAAGVNGGINVTAPSPLSWKLQMREENKDDTLEAGKELNATVSLNTDGKVTVSGVTAAWSSGTSMLETGDDTNVDEGYVKSDLATHVLYDTDADQDTLKVEYAGAESYAQVYVAAPSISTGSTTTVTTITDAEAATSGAGKNLIVVGGSCINTVAAELLGGALCGADFSAKANNVGAGMFLIRTFERPGVAGKVATLVAGYDATDTVNAANALTTKTVEIAVGKAYTGTTAETLTAVA